MLWIDGVKCYNQASGVSQRTSVGANAARRTEFSVGTGGARRSGGFDALDVERGFRLPIRLASNALLGSAFAPTRPVVECLAEAAVLLAAEGGEPVERLG